MQDVKSFSPKLCNQERKHFSASQCGIPHSSQKGVFQESPCFANLESTAVQFPKTSPHVSYFRLALNCPTPPTQTPIAFGRWHFWEVPRKCGRDEEGKRNRGSKREWGGIVFCNTALLYIMSRADFASIEKTQDGFQDPLRRCAITSNPATTLLPPLVQDKLILK